MAGNTSATGGFVKELSPPPPSADVMANVLQVMVATLSTLQGSLVRPRWQVVPPVQPPLETNWAAVGVIATEADEFPWIEHVGGNPVTGDAGHDIMRRHQTVTVMVTFYGPEADDYAWRMRDALYVPQNSEPFNEMLQAKFQSVADLQRVPELVNQQWLNRIDLRMTLRQQIDRVYPILDIRAALIALRTDSGTGVDVAIREASGWDDDESIWDGGESIWDLANTLLPVVRPPSAWDGGASAWDYGATTWDALPAYRPPPDWVYGASAWDGGATFWDDGNTIFDAKVG